MAKVPSVGMWRAPEHPGEPEPRGAEGPHPVHVQQPPSPLPGLPQAEDGVRKIQHMFSARPPWVQIGQGPRAETEG